ncbi:MAG: SRPBCC family protein [Anaerolineales bacterium]|jgi:uncharacterized membrane protein
MIEFENEVTINKPVDEVYPFVADLENIPLWNYFVMEVTKQTNGAIAVGTEYHQVRKTDSQDLTIKELVPNRKLTVETIPPSKPSLTRTILFSGDDERTQISDQWKLDTGSIGLLERIAARRVKRAVSENLGKLKEVLETGGTTLQDGRSVHL